MQPNAVVAKCQNHHTRNCMQSSQEVVCRQLCLLHESSAHLHHFMMLVMMTHADADDDDDYADNNDDDVDDADDGFVFIRPTLGTDTILRNPRPRSLHLFSTARNAFWLSSTFPTCFIRALPLVCNN